jgi:hypothetical protein
MHLLIIDNLPDKVTAGIIKWSQTGKSDLFVAILIELSVMNSFTPKAAAKHQLLFKNRSLAFEGCAALFRKSKLVYCIEVI